MKSPQTVPEVTPETSVVVVTGDLTVLSSVLVDQEDRLNPKKGK